MRRTLRVLASAIASLVLPFAATRDARANPPDTYGFGSRETGMGGAVAAEVRGPAASYYNPASLVRSRGLEISLGYMRADHHLETNGRDNAVDPVKGINGGLALPGRVLGVPIAFGLAVHLPDDRISRVRALRQEQPRWELYDNRNQRLFLAANLALRPLSWLELGGGLSFMSSTRGRLDITGSANAFAPDSSQLRHEVDADLTAIRYPQAGARVTLSDRVALAAVYRGEFQLGLDLSARLAGDVSGLTTALYTIETSSVNNFLPRQAVLGGAWRITGDLVTTFDATWMNWSAYVPPVARLNVVLDIPPPPGGWPASITPPTAPAPARIAPLVMHDRVVPRVGAEWRALHRAKLDAFVRGGYEWAKSPIEPQTGLTNYVDRDRHTLSFGLGATLRRASEELPGDVSLDAHLQWSELVTDTTRKSSPADFVGDYTAGGRIVAFGASVSLAFDGGGARGEGGASGAKDRGEGERAEEATK